MQLQVCAGLFNTTEAMLLAIGEASSRQVLVYRWLALWYDDNAHFTAVLQRQMFYPMAVTAIALITEPLAAVFRQELSLTAYLLTLALQLTLVIGSYRWLIRYLRYRQVQYFNEPWFAAVLSGAVSQTSFLRKVYERNYLKLLWLMLDAGLDAQQSLAKLAKLSRNAKWRRRHSDAARLLQAGQPLHSTLATSALLSRPDNLGVLSSAEQSGTISKALGHHLGLLDDSIQQQFEVRASWAGRLLYFGILLFVAVVFFA